jgi:hypothetical protein
MKGFEEEFKSQIENKNWELVHGPKFYKTAI